MKEEETQKIDTKRKQRQCQGEKKKMLLKKIYKNCA